MQKVSNREQGKRREKIYAWSIYVSVKALWKNATVDGMEILLADETIEGERGQCLDISTTWHNPLKNL